MNQTDTTETNSDERIRKIYAKDLKVGETVHTVFRTTRKEKHASRGGKSYLSLSLVDRTGEIDGRVFDNVEAADQAFSADDYLLVKGKIGSFHGKTQIVIDRLERLDPGPIDAAEFTFIAPAAPEKAEKSEKPTRDEYGKKDDETRARVRLSKRLEKLLEHPQLVQALDNFVAHLEKAIAAAGPRPERADRAERAEGAEPRRERKPKGPRSEFKSRTPDQAGAPKQESKPAAEAPKRDPSLPDGLAFKPFNALVGEGEKTETPKP